MKQVIVQIQDYLAIADSPSHQKDLKLDYHLQDLLHNLSHFVTEFPDFKLATIATGGADSPKGIMIDPLKPYPEYDSYQEAALSKVPLRLQPVDDLGVPKMMVHVQLKLDDDIVEAVYNATKHHPEIGNMRFLSSYVFEYDYPCHCDMAQHCKTAYNIIYKAVYGTKPK